MPRRCTAAVLMLSCVSCQSLLGIEDTTEGQQDGDAGAGIDADNPNDIDGSPGAPDAALSGYTLLVDTEVPRVNRDSSVFLQIVATREPGFKDAINVELTDLPAGVTSGTATIDAGETTANLQVTAIANAPLGTADVTLQGMAGAVVRSSNVALLVADPPGTLDETFGTGGIVTFAAGGDIVNRAQSVIVQDDGKIVVGGGPANVIRLNADGSFDDSFDGDGVLEFGDDGNVIAIDVTSTGAIVAAGSNFGPGFFVRRVDANGAADTTFGDGGTFNLAGMVLMSDMVVDAVDNVLYVGSNSVATFSITRLTAAGVLDTSFNGDGRYLPPFMSAVRGVFTRDDLSLAAIGSFNGGMMFVDLDSAGVENPGFDGDGSSILDPAFHNQCSGVDLIARADGTLVAAGQCGDGFPNLNGASGSVTATGSTNTAYGFMMTGIGDGTSSGTRSETRALVEQADGRIVLAGAGNLTGFTDNEESTAIINRIQATGGGDSSFTSVRFGNFQDTSFVFNDVALQPDGRIVAVGHNADEGWMIVRVWH